MVGEKNIVMKNESFNWEKLPQIENNVYGRFESLIKTFHEKFAEYCCYINIEECWTTNKKRELYLERPPMGTEYIYWLSYRVMNRNKPVVYDQENSYLERAYGVVEVYKKKSWGTSEVKIIVLDSLDDIECGLKEDLEFVKNTYQDARNSTGK